MILPNDYDSTNAYSGSYDELPVGGHICRILDAKMQKSRNGNDMICVAFDIAENGPHDGFYKAQFERKKKYDVESKWPGMFRTAILNKDGKCSGYFKGLITSIEESNTGYSFKAANCEEATLKGKLVGFNFGEEEYEPSNSPGEVRSTVKPFYAVSVATVREGIDPPKKKEIRRTGASQSASHDFMEVPDEPLPF